MRTTLGYVAFLLIVFATPTLVGVAATLHNFWVLVIASLVLILGTVFGMLWATREGDSED